MGKRISTALAAGLLGAACLLGAAPSLAGPFGVQMGAPISSIPGAKPSKTIGEVTVYSVNTLPAPNPEFEYYLIMASAKTGICKVTGIGKDHPGDATGVKVRGIFENLSNALAQKYGSSKLVDFLHADALWNKPGEFAMALTEEEYSLSRFWDEEEKSTLPADISGISLEAGGKGRDVTYVALRYELRNFEACTDLIDKARSVGL